jgi:pimeloyl-ACP methyl ester carboxylesterase
VFPHLAEQLESAGYRVLMFDYFGRMHSDTPHVQYDDKFYVSQLSQLLYALGVGGERIHLIGLSMGGAVVTRFAQHFPSQVQSIVTFAPAGLPFNSPLPAKIAANVPFAATILGYTVLPTIMTSRMLAEAPVPSERSEQQQEDLDNLVNQLKFQLDHTPGFVRSFASALTHFPLNDVQDAYRAVYDANIPMFNVWGTNDAVLPYENHKLLQQLIPTAQHFQIEGGSHTAVLFSHDLYKSQLLKFLKQHAIQKGQ